MTRVDSRAPVEIPRTLGWLLVSGATIFWVGAVTPPYRQWMGVPLEEYLHIVQAHPLNWLLMHGCFAAGTILTLTGVSGLSAVLGSANARGWYLAIAALGAALLETRALRPWAGRTALVFGALAVPGLATPVFQPPLMIFVAPFVLGIAILRAPRKG